MRLPSPRGTLSAAIVDRLRRSPDDVTSTLPEHADDRADAALALWTAQELHYRGFDHVDDHHEWDPALLGARRALESDLEQRLRDERPAPSRSGDVVADLLAVVDAHDGPSLARHLQQHATREQAEELLRQRSIYHLKEADPTAWVVPRLGATVKAALLEVQFDEYGCGDPARLHHHLFEQGLVASGLDGTYGAYLDGATTEVLEQNTAMTMFGLQRRLRGAALGHFAAFEMTSSLPSRQLVQGLERLGFPAAMVHYYDEHVEADAVHEQLALRDVCGVLVREEPELADDVLFGAWACLELEAATARDLLASWLPVAA